MDDRMLMLTIGATVAGVAVAIFLFMVLTVVFRERATSAATWEFEARRLITLRDGNATYRWFEPLIQDLAATNRQRASSELAKIKIRLTASCSPLPWLPEEYLAARQFEAMIIVGIVCSLATVVAGLALGLIFGVIAGILYFQMAMRDLADRSARRCAQLKRRLPFAVDLIALMLEAGAGLMDSLNTLCADLRGHPLGDELGLVVREVNMGRSVREGLTRLQERVPDEDLAELVFMIVKGEEFGTPMALTFRTQANQMRLKRSQWIEKASAAAQVSIVLPGMVIMIACLLIISAPFVLDALKL